jgi:hypothetical protein
LYVCDDGRRAKFLENFAKIFLKGSAGGTGVQIFENI